MENDKKEEKETINEKIETGKSTNKKEENDQKMLMGILSYLGPLVLIPILTNKKDPFVGFHIKQGLVLVCIMVGLWLLGSFMPLLNMIISLAHIAVLILSVIGIINVVGKKQKELPFVGKFAKNFKI